MFKLNKSKYQVALLVILTLYVTIYWWFMHRADYLPYVFDNNETYSSLVHAYNMYFGDWGKHFGLTDESFNPDPDAHPYLHTHQGNWPRILAFILFILGSRSAESQIFIHTLTIGTLSIWLMFRFFVHSSTLRFASIACLVFMTDYILFAQWQVVTYRVWHVFFLFSSLNCMQGLVKEQGYKWRILTFINFMCLSYWELVFALYITIWAFLYYSFATRFTLAKLFKAWTWISAGCITGIGILLAQLSLFMGFRNAITDLYITFFARNFSSDKSATQSLLKSFYEDKGIAGFYNIVDGSAYRSVVNFIRSFFEYGLKVHTPALSVTIFIIGSAIIISLLKRKLVFSRWYNYECDIFFAQVITSLNILFLSITVLSDASYLGASMIDSLDNNMNIFMYLISAIVAFVGGAYITRKCCIVGYMRTIDFVAINLFIFFSTFILNGHLYLYTNSYGVIWYNTLTNIWPNYIWQGIMTIAVVVGLMITMQRSTDIYLFKDPQSIFHYLVSGITAYSVVYFISPGYVMTGYLYRYAPFLVFIIDVLVALCVYYLFNCSYLQIRTIKSKPMFLTAVTTLFTFIISQWFFMQHAYMQLFPADSFNFIKEVRREPLFGDSIVTNHYPLPAGYEANSWSYMATDIKTEMLLPNHQSIYSGLNGHEDYIWHKNKKDFSGYRFPDLHMCFIPNSFYNISIDMIRNDNHRIWCEKDPVVRLSKNNKSAVDHKVILRDKTTRDRWAIVKYEWEK